MPTRTPPKILVIGNRDRAKKKSECGAQVVIHGVRAKCARGRHSHKVHRGFAEVFETARPNGWTSTGYVIEWPQPLEQVFP